ncbi:MAG: phosphatidylinositol dimannoside acyltransferase [Frankiaceae bacterium]|nr:phosphatidylinositol dimannoside acyltransferase [Frankiaceae bacterium]
MRWLPEPVVRRLFDRIADLALRKHGRGVRRLEQNLRRVVGQDADLDPVLRAAMRSYLRYWCEAFRLPVMRPERIVSGTRVLGEQAFRAALASGRGVVAALPHMGNWDLAGAWAVLTDAPFTTVAERLEPEALFTRFVEFRESIGMEVIPLTGGERAPAELLRERLAGGGFVCLLADRDLTSAGVPVSFFGGTTKVPAGPAALALDSGATLFPVTLWYDGPTHVIRFHDPVEHPAHGTRAEQVRVMAQQVADAFAEGIAEHPEDWHMLQRIWVEEATAEEVS